MSYDCYCVDCGWHGAWEELFSDAVEDSDGDMSGVLDACPECGGQTEDIQ